MTISSFVYSIDTIGTVSLGTMFTGRSTSLPGLPTGFRLGRSVVVPFGLLGLFLIRKSIVLLGMSLSISTILDLIIYPRSSTYTYNCNIVSIYPTNTLIRPRSTSLSCLPLASRVLGFI